MCQSCVINDPLPAFVHCSCSAYKEGLSCFPIKQISPKLSLLLMLCEIKEVMVLNQDSSCELGEVVTALGCLRQEDLEFEASLDYIARPCPKKKIPPLCYSILYTQIPSLFSQSSQR
jgi:hypothetical protein